MYLYKNKYRISTTRLKTHDYGSKGLYFITIVTKNRRCFFGKITKTKAGRRLIPTVIGRIAIEFWRAIPQHYPFVELDEFIVMPNHIHGILYLNNPEKTDWQPNTFGRQSRNIPAIIRGFKSSLKRYANQNDICFEWHPRYHDIVIRNKKSLENIRKYIRNNPSHW